MTMSFRQAVKAVEAAGMSVSDDGIAFTVCGGQLVNGQDASPNIREMNGWHVLEVAEQLTNSQPCTHCSGTGRALYFSEQGWGHEERDCHICRSKQLTNSQRPEGS